MSDRKEMKKEMSRTLFGEAGIMTKAEFRLALSKIVDDLVDFKQKVFSGIDKIKKGNDGINGRDGRNGSDGHDGRDGIDGAQGSSGKNGKDGSPDTGEEVIRKVNNDPSDSLIRKGKIEGLEDIESMARTADMNSRSFMNTGSYVYAQDISDQLNGVLKTLTLVSNAKVILAFGSSAPGVF
ncbi:MAG: hypothetical protein AAB922_06585, partial [Patescibacteria group bacterium]